MCMLYIYLNLNQGMIDEKWKNCRFSYFFYYILKNNFFVYNRMVFIEINFATYRFKESLQINTLIVYRLFNILFINFYTV